MMASNDNELLRVQALHALDILDTPPEEAFDRFARLAAGIFGVPVARVSLIDSEREFLKATLGCEREPIARDKSFCTWTVALDAPLIVQDLASDARFRNNPRVVGGPKYRFYAGAPLKNREGHNLGAICCLDVRPRRPSAAQINLLQDLAQVVVEAMELRRVATTDGLTGALTRRAYFDAARRDIRLAARTGRPLACLLLDVDLFKTVNDTHGHAAGDEVLRRLCALCREALRDSDYCGRIGGEEFAILLRDTKVEDAYEIAERLRGTIARQTFISEERRWQVTASFGLAGLRKGHSADALFAAADAALYTAKRLGRNRTQLSETETLLPPRRTRLKLTAVA